MFWDWFVPSVELIVAYYLNQCGLSSGGRFQSLKYLEKLFHVPLSPARVTQACKIRVNALSESPTGDITG